MVILIFMKQAKLFGGDTPEQREQKLKQITETIENLRRTAADKSAISEDYLKSAQKEVENFKKYDTNFKMSSTLPICTLPQHVLSSNSLSSMTKTLFGLRTFFPNKEK